MRRAPLAVVLLSIVGFAVPLASQTPAANPGASVLPDQHIRMTFTALTPSTQTQYGPIDAPPTTETGTVVWVRGDTIAFRPDGTRDTSQVTAVTGPRIERLDFSSGTHRHTLAGLAWGGIGGAVLGAALGAASYKRCAADVFGACFNVGSQAGYAAGGALLFGLLGGGIGAIVGTFIQTEKWVRVPGYPVAKVSIRPLPHGGIGYGLALSF